MTWMMLHKYQLSAAFGQIKCLGLDGAGASHFKEPQGHSDLRSGLNDNGLHGPQALFWLRTHDHTKGKSSKGPSKPGYLVGC